MLIRVPVECMRRKTDLLTLYFEPVSKQTTPPHQRQPRSRFPGIWLARKQGAIIDGAGQPIPAADWAGLHR